jgi:phospholipid/cholesterol/gamma-HCH transport system substrate-binding protein
MKTRRVRAGLAAALVLTLIAAAGSAILRTDRLNRTTITAYFANSNGLFTGDEVRILGVPVGKIVSIEPHPDTVKITFWFDKDDSVPADAKAVILSPSLVTARAIELTPAYTGGPRMANNAVIPRDRTAVPVEWDDFRSQLQRLTDMLKPMQPGGVSTLGAFINTAADNLRGQGSNIHDAIVKLSQAVSALGDHSTDIFTTIKNLATLVSALQGSAGLMRNLNQNLAAVTGMLSSDPGAIGSAADDLNTAVGQVKDFVADNRETLGVSVDKLSSISTALTDSLGDIKQTLHVAPTSIANFTNIYQPAQATFTGVLAASNFTNPIGFLCGAIQAASRLNAEQSSKLCVQYLAPIVKNRQFNFPPIGLNPIVGAQARPNEVTYSEDWMRPDYVPHPGGGSPRDPKPDAAAQKPADPQPPLPAEVPSTDNPAPTSVSANPAAGLTGLMVPPGGGS